MKVKKYAKALLLATIVMLKNTTASAILLGTEALSGSAGSRSISTYINYELGYDVDMPVFKLLGLTHGDQGTTFVLNSGSDFENTVTFLTNGNDLDAMYERKKFGLSGGGSSNFSAELFMLPTIIDIDFNAWAITAFELTINSLTIVTPGDNPNGDGIWSNYYYDFSLNVIGEKKVMVPEPTTLALLGFGLAAFGCKRCRSIKPL